MRLFKCNQTYEGKTPLISAIHFWSDVQLQVLTHWKYYRNKMFLLDQPNTFRAVIFLLHPCLFKDACIKPALALPKSRLVCKHSKSCSFSPCLSANPVCSPCWFLAHLLIHISKLHLLLMLSAVSGLLDQWKRQWWFSPTSPMLPSHSLFCHWRGALQHSATPAKAVTMHFFTHTALNWVMTITSLPFHIWLVPSFCLWPFCLCIL